MVREVEEHFRLLDPSIPAFNHYTPSEYLLREDVDLDGIDESLDRFEKLFTDLNKLL